MQKQEEHAKTKITTNVDIIIPSMDLEILAVEKDVAVMVRKVLVCNLVHVIPNMMATPTVDVDPVGGGGHVQLQNT